MTTYKIVRSFFNGGKRTIKTGLTLEQAQAHCRNPETSSRTATSAKAHKLTEERGAWFDGYTVEKPKRSRFAPAAAPRARFGI